MSREEYEEYYEMIPPTPFYWWLRSPGSDRREAAYVVSEKNVHKLCCVQYEHVEYYPVTQVFGVRPVLLITGHDLKSGDILKLADKEWTVLSDTLAICNDLIGMCHFNTGTNDYEFSDVEMYLETWAKDNNILTQDFHKLCHNIIVTVHDKECDYILHQNLNRHRLN